jgi:predicted secreted Zn-dependent protease
MNTTLEYYEVPDTTLSEAVARLNQTRLQGPDGPPSQGLTRYSIDAEWRAVAGDGACRVEDVVVTVDIVITLPEWPELPRRPEREQRGWAQIDGALRNHEYAHRDLTVEAAKALRDDLEGRETVGCGTLEQVVETSLRLAGGRLNEAHAELDRSTPARLPIG